MKASLTFVAVAVAILGVIFAVLIWVDSVRQEGHKQAKAAEDQLEIARADLVREHERGDLAEGRATESQKHADSLRDRLDEAIADRDNLQTLLVDAVQNLNATTRDKGALQLHVQSLTRELSEAEAHVQALRLENDQLTKSVDDEHDALTRVEAANAFLADRAEGAEEKVRQYRWAATVESAVAGECANKPFTAGYQQCGEKWRNFLAPYAAQATKCERDGFGGSTYTLTADRQGASANSLHLRNGDVRFCDRKLSDGE